MACHVLPSAFFQNLEEHNGRIVARFRVPEFQLEQVVGFWLPDTSSWWRFLGLSFMLFSFKTKYTVPLPNFVFTADCRNRVGPTLFPETRLSLCVFMPNPVFNLHEPDFLNCQVTLAFRQQGGGGLSLRFCRFLLSVYFYIGISDAPFKWTIFFVQLIGGVCLFCHLSHTLILGCFVCVALLAIFQNLFLKNTRLLHNQLFVHIFAILTINRPVHCVSIKWQHIHKITSFLVSPGIFYLTAQVISLEDHVL